MSRIIKMSSLLLVAVLMLALVLSAHSQSNVFKWETKKGPFELSERIAKKVAAGEKLIIRVSTWDPISPFFQDVRSGIEKLASETGADIKLIGPFESSAEKQVSELESLIKADLVDGLAISCGDADIMMPIFDLAWGKGIPIVTYDCDSPASKRLAYIGADHFAIGEVAAENIMKLHPKKTGKIAFFAAFSEGVYARERIKGLKDVLSKNGYNLEGIGPFSLSLDRDKAYGVVENTFLANPDIDIIFTVDEMVEVVGEYVSRKNLGDKVVLIGVNTIPGVLQHVKTGIINATIGPNPYLQGYIAAKTVYDFMTSGATIEEFKAVDLEIVTADNVKDFLK